MVWNISHGKTRQWSICLLFSVKWYITCISSKRLFWYYILCNIPIPALTFYLLGSVVSNVNKIWGQLYVHVYTLLSCSIVIRFYMLFYCCLKQKKMNGWIWSMKFACSFWLPVWRLQCYMIFVHVFFFSFSTVIHCVWQHCYVYPQRSKFHPFAVSKWVVTQWLIDWLIDWTLMALSAQ